MALNTNTKAAAKAKIKLGYPLKEISLEFDIPVSTLYTFKQKMAKEADDELVKELTDIPTEVVAHIVEEAKAIKTIDTTEVQQFEAVSSGLEGLKKLDMSFQTTVTKALTRFNKLLDDEDTPLKDIKMIIDTSAIAYEKMFNSGTNIHIGDNNSHSTQTLSVFKNKMGV